ncbi:hypothetical protein [Kitasatospora griseola]|uniref:hypothetical protein n=1 Tax=Kitasatospora griseola TaxID=2064 RepID=UPI0038236CF9
MARCPEAAPCCAPAWPPTPSPPDWPDPPSRRSPETPSGDQVLTLTGQLPTGAPDFARLPVEVPRGAREIAVSYSYDRPTVRLITDEGQLHQESLPATGTATLTWRTTPSLATYVRAEVRHPKPDGTPGKGNSMGLDLPWGPMAALTNPIVLHGS